MRKICCYPNDLLCFQFQFQRTFESLKNVSNKSDLKKTYQKLGKDLENLDYLAFKRQQVGLRALLGGGYEHFQSSHLSACQRFRWVWGDLYSNVWGRNKLCCVVLTCCVHMFFFFFFFLLQHSALSLLLDVHFGGFHVCSYTFLKENSCWLVRVQLSFDEGCFSDIKGTSMWLE